MKTFKDRVLILGAILVSVTFASCQKDPSGVSSQVRQKGDRLSWFTPTFEEGLTKAYVDMTNSASQASCPVNWQNGDEVFVLNGHTISNLTLGTASANRGLFGILSGATVSNLTLLNPSITGGTSFIGALAGKSINSNLSSVTVTGGTVSGSGNTIGGEEELHRRHCRPCQPGCRQRLRTDYTVHLRLQLL